MTDGPTEPIDTTGILTGVRLEPIEANTTTTTAFALTDPAKGTNTTIHIHTFGSGDTSSAGDAPMTFSFSLNDGAKQGSFADPYQCLAAAFAEAL